MATQDLPPPGGFGTIPVGRTLPKPLMRQSVLALIGFAATCHGMYYLREYRKRTRILQIEQHEHFVAVHPFLIAEQERKFLIHLWHLREDERKLMKDHPGWKLGTLYGEKIYKTQPADTIPYLHPDEFMVFRPSNEWFSKVSVPDFWF